MKSEYYDEHRLEFKIRKTVDGLAYYIEERTYNGFSNWKEVHHPGSLETIIFPKYNDAVQWLHSDIVKRVGAKILGCR